MRQYMRSYTRLRRLYQQKAERYRPYLDERGCVSVRVLVSFSLHGQRFTRGEVVNLRWELVARLEAAVLVELVRPEETTSAAGTGHEVTAPADVASLRRAMKALGRAKV